MKLADLYARPGLTLSVEFFPPKTEKGEENLFSEIEIIKRLNPGFCSVTYGAGGSTREKTLDLVEAIHDRLRTGGHVSLDRGRTVQRRCARDPEPAQKQKDRKRPCAGRRSAPGNGRIGAPIPMVFSYAIELVREAAALGCFSIGVAGFPEIHPRAVEPRCRI